jgi:hypothetical protein
MRQISFVSAVATLRTPKIPRCNYKPEYQYDVRFKRTLSRFPIVENRPPHNLLQHHVTCDSSVTEYPRYDLHHAFSSDLVILGVDFPVLSGLRGNSNNATGQSNLSSSLLLIAKR